MTADASTAEEPAEVDVLDSGEAGGMAIRGGALRTVAFFVATLFSLVSVPFMTRHLGAGDYGLYATATSYLFIIAGVTEAGLTQLGTREYSVRRGRDRDRYLRNLVGLRLALTLSGILVALGITLVSGAATAVVVGILILGVGALLSMTQQTYSVTLSARLRFGWISGLELVRQATLSLSIIGLVLLHAGLVPFFFTSVLSGGAVLVLTLVVLRQDSALAPAFDLATWRRMVLEVLPYAAASAVGLIYFRLAIIIMSAAASEQETGVYAAASRIIETVGVLPWLLVSGAFPILARAARDDMARLQYGLGRLFDVSVLIAVLVCGSVIIVAPFAVEIVAGSEFMGAVPVLRILALSSITSFFAAAWSYGLLSLAAYRAMLVCNSIAAVASAALCVGLIPVMGAEGAALATLGAELALVGAYLVALGRRDRAFLPSLSTPLRIIPATVAMALVGLLLHLHPLVETAIGAALFTGLAFACGAVPGELIAALLRRSPAEAGAPDGADTGT